MRHVTRNKTNLPTSSKKEPLAEGLQVTVPTDSAGRRLWSKLTDEQVVDHAKKVMKKDGISGKKELEKIDQRLYQVLRTRGLLDEVGFAQKRRYWKKMSDEQIIELARSVMDKREITGRKELGKADQELYHALRKRKLLDEVGFAQKRREGRSWKDMSNEEVVEFARKVMIDNDITGRKELKNTDGGLYNTLQKRNLLERAFAKIDQQKTDLARDAVIDALEAFAANDNASAEDDVA